MRLLAIAVTMAVLRLTAAAVIWIPADFDSTEDGPIVTRDTTASISCGSSFPDNFYCPSTTTCLALNTTASIIAALCCPVGQDCAVISPVNCDQSLQNATTSPNSQLHSDPTVTLNTCGSECCPMGYSCKSDQCYALTAEQVAGSSSSISSTATAIASAMSAPTSPSTTAAGPTAATADGSSSTSSWPATTSKSTFSGASFAAGFIPGLVLGALLLALILLLFYRRRRRPSNEGFHEKGHGRETLTDLSTLHRRPTATAHGRSISEPTAMHDSSHRTDFLRSTPPQGPVLTPLNTSYTVKVSGPANPSRASGPVRALFSRSPFLNNTTPPSPRRVQPPMPAHLKRGTLSYTISPIRALKKQKSMHSLRRQMTSDTQRSNSSRHGQRPNISSSASTETIQVPMPSNEPYTPNQRLPFNQSSADTKAPRHASLDSTTTWETDSADGDDAKEPRTPYATSSRYPTEVITPTRFPIPDFPFAKGVLGTPYTPSKRGAGEGMSSGGLGGLMVPGHTGHRDTRFSTMMERAGLKMSDLVGTKPGWKK